MANASQAQKNIARSFLGEGPETNVLAAGPAPASAPPAPVPAGLILQSFFKNVAPAVLTGPTASTLIPGAAQAITTVANSKLRVTVMHGIFLNAVGANAQLGIEIKVDGAPVGIVFTPTLITGAADNTTGSVMYQASLPAGLHNVEIARTLQNAANVGTIGPNFPLQMLVEEISG